MYLAVFSVLLAFLIYTNPLFRCFMTGGCSRFSFGDCVVGLAASLGNAMQQPDPTALSAHESHRADIAKYRKAADANLKFFADLMAPVELAECCDLRAVQIPGTRWSVGGPSAMTEAFVVVPKQPFLNASGSPAKRPLGVLYHGGGMVIGRALDDKMALTLACELNAVVVAPNYALAPEHPYPAGIEDSYAALVWAAEHAEELGADLSRTFVGGVSAGGLVTAVVSQLALDRGGPKIKLQFLGNAMLSPLMTESKLREFNAHGVLPTKMISWMWQMYHANPFECARDPRCTPLARSDMKGLPQALVFIGKADVLASEDFEYARRLERDLVPVSVMAVRGSHACLGFDANIGKVVDRMKEMLA